MILKITTSVLFMALIIFGYWIAGFNFDERGSAAATCYALAVMMGIIGALIPKDFFHK